MASFVCIDILYTYSLVDVDHPGKMVPIMKCGLYHNTPHSIILKSWFQFPIPTACLHFLGAGLWPWPLASVRVRVPALPHTRVVTTAQCLLTGAAVQVGWPVGQARPQQRACVTLFTGDQWGLSQSNSPWSQLFSAASGACTAYQSVYTQD